MTTESVIEFTVQLELKEGNTEDLDEMARELLQELLEQPVESAELVSSGEVPAGSKASEVVTGGALAIAVLPNLLPKIVEFIQTWVLRGTGRTVKFKGKVSGQGIEFEGSSQDFKLVLAMLEAHQPAGKLPGKNQERRSTTKTGTK